MFLKKYFFNFSDEFKDGFYDIENNFFNFENNFADFDTNNDNTTRMQINIQVYHFYDF